MSQHDSPHFSPHLVPDAKLHSVSSSAELHVIKSRPSQPGLPLSEDFSYVTLQMVLIIEEIHDKCSSSELNLEITGIFVRSSSSVALLTDITLDAVQLVY